MSWWQWVASWFRVDPDPVLPYREPVCLFCEACGHQVCARTKEIAQWMLDAHREDTGHG